jgi:CO/xanthine dehydrogenase Mo-binding subunit
LEGFHTYCIGPYDIPNVSMDGEAIYTNNLPGCAFRGFGSPQACFAAEMQMDRLAELLDIDPITLRLRNCHREGSTYPTQSEVPPGISLPELIAVCARRSGYKETISGWTPPQYPPSSTRRRGIGISAGMQTSGIGFGYQEFSQARVILHGGAQVESVEVHTAAVDVGQGSHATLAQIAAETLDVPISMVRVLTSDTALIGDSGPASASRLTLFAGNAVAEAARMAMAKWKDEERPAVAELYLQAGETSSPDPETGACVDHLTCTCVSEVVELEVDLTTGEVDLIRIVVATDPGRVIDPQRVEGQIQGAVTQAAGWTLVENVISRGGEIISDRFSTYLIPTADDIAERLECILLENPDPIGPFGARGVGEVPFVSLAPAIISAIHHAAGIWLDELPATPEKLMAKMKRIE